VKTQSHDLHLLTGSYALDALVDGDELAEFDEHMSRCPSCAEEVRGLQETAARLAMATAVYPPPEMRAAVLAAVPLTRQLPPLAHGHRRVPAGRAGLRRLSKARAGLTTGVLALAAALVFLLVTQVSTSNQLHQQQASNRAVAAVLAAPDAQVKALPATAGGTVTAVMSLHAQQAVVTSAHLPDLTGGRVYQLWVISASGAARSAGLMTVAASGSSAPALASGVVTGDRLGITVEPAGGTAQPTTTPVVLLPVTA
jgi:anti-sigma-K factor RskA